MYLLKDKMEKEMERLLGSDMAYATMDIHEFPVKFFDVWEKRRILEDNLEGINGPWLWAFGNMDQDQNPVGDIKAIFGICPNIKGTMEIMNLDGDKNGNIQELSIQEVLNFITKTVNEAEMNQEREL